MSLFCQNLPIRTRPQQPSRIATSGRRAASDDSSSGSRPNPVLDEYRKQNPGTAPPGLQPGQQMPKQGDIASSSIFEDDRRIQEQRGKDEEAEEGKTKVGGITRDPNAIARVVIPDPASRERWERKKVIQMVKKGGRLTKPEFLKRTEREHLVKSHNMKTSVKKLGMIARQIAGKTIDDAIVQMRFSPKKVAQEVLKQLEFARDEAVVMRGMGLKPTTEDDAEVLNESSTNIAGTTAAGLEAARGALAQRITSDNPISIQLKDGKRHKIEDPTKIYIDQAWVGRGPYGKLPDYRARGRVFIMRTPWTSLTVVLKEEKTRIREHEEREAKRRKKITEQVWVPLPDRPIQTHRQWYSW
ncbi:54S ribosomal protein L22, mitochondrial [Pseudocercospora fuligena]|uniref:54S ribosomal protein L22, mitochondrial n=1 Tax=Pseudocercospora fuligena TaxID=685502 RepID=A0A8H6VJP2_9PEZI|nr:54S ribosomal protein L22, mitochondrial [Pseudocercospora fuligena]